MELLILAPTVGFLSSHGHAVATIWQHQTRATWNARGEASCAEKDLFSTATIFVSTHPCP